MDRVIHDPPNLAAHTSEPLSQVLASHYKESTLESMSLPPKTPAEAPLPIQDQPPVFHSGPPERAAGSSEVLESQKRPGELHIPESSVEMGEYCWLAVHKVSRG